MQALVAAYRASLIDVELKVYDAINALPKLASGKALFALSSPDTIEAHEIDPPMLYVLETKNPAAVEAQVRAMYEGMNDPVKTKRQYKKFQIEEQVGASTVFGQGRLIHALTTKGMENLLDNLITPPPKPLSPVLAKLREARPNADVYVRLSADGVARLELISAYPADEWDRAEAVLPGLRERFPQVVFVGLLSEGDFAPADEAMDVVVHSFEEAAAEAAVRYSKAPVA